MNVLIWGASCFLGHSLISTLKDMREKSVQLENGAQIGEIFACDSNTDNAKMDEACSQADFVINISNAFDSDVLLESLLKHQNPCPMVLGSSVKSLENFRDYAEKNDVTVLEWSPVYDMELLSVEAQVDDMLSAMQCA
ncbi:MAG: hypothetical protein MJZ22_03570 [Candidatus Saccharibacteria bacterium]|nr:hypothetical protein [Candidatus Saccharibacteria bacterium]